MASKQQRLEVFLQRLEQASPASSHDEGFELIRQTLNATEADLTDIPFDPDSWMDDGRMYPPQEDSAFDVPGHSSVTRYRSRQHNTFISDWGAIEIHSTNGTVLFQKTGQNGKGVWE